MFTGIVEDVATLERVEAVGDCIELELEVRPETSAGTRVGDSVAVNGCCLTVTAAGGSRLTFQAIPETLRRTSLGERRVGERVNVERALRADGRLDGHIVQGHVDGTGVVAARSQRGDDVLLRVDCPSELASLLVQKGSVTLDGVSLTVVDPDPGGFSVALIPHTLAVTTLAERQAGDRVNIEVDVIGKYVDAYLRRAGKTP